MDVREFEEFGHMRQHDRVLYCMGDSEWHGHVYELLRGRPGVVVLHDVRLTGFYRWYAGVERPEDPERALADRIWAMYGDRLPAEAMPGLELDRGLLDRQVDVCVLPFGMPDTVQASRQGTAPGPLIVSLGSGHENGIATLIDAFSLLAVDIPAARLVITSDGGDPAESDRWHRYASDHAPQADIELAGEVSAQRYAELLHAADLAVQLQPLSGGEAPAAVADCIAGGVPTIVTDLGWASELPADAADKVPPGIGPGQLKDRILTLLTDNDTRAEITRAALDYAHGCSFSTAADACLNALNLK
jgi:glycosyltransferase involved in cell wall biosynthesis